MIELVTPFFRNGNSRSSLFLTDSCSCMCSDSDSDITEAGAEYEEAIDLTFGNIKNEMSDSDVECFGSQEAEKHFKV